ncbi:MAG: nucleoside phosphorylase [Nanobdellota archaeon]
MAYPNFKSKHLEKALFSADDYIDFRYDDMSHLPKKWVVLFQKSTERYVRRKFKLKKEKLHNFAGNVYIDGDVGFIKMNGIGAPHMVTVIEELISTGAHEFIIVGTAGGLQNLGVFMCNRAIRDEGTSHHYISSGKYSYPDMGLSSRFEKQIDAVGLGFEKGTTWTIDAPYRETKTEIDYYKRSGVKTVEMEASALFALGKVRNVKTAAAFIVSDVVAEEVWDPQFDARHVKIKLNRLVDAAVETLSD